MKKRRANKKIKQSFDNLREYSQEAVVSNENLVTEILLRVSAKSLIRFKCVSKRWLSLISDPIFCSNHAHQNYNSLVCSGIYLYNKFGSPHFQSFVIPDRTQSIPNFDFLLNAEISDSCNGLILCYIDLTGYAVCNSTTRKFKMIFPNPRDTRFCFRRETCLVFDPLKSNQYKVLEFVHNSDCHHLKESDIYSSENSSWKSMNISIGEREHRQPEITDKFYWNNDIYWLASWDFYIQLDIGTEIISSTPLPQISEDHSIEYFGSCRNSLILVISTPTFTVFEKERNINSWIVKYRIKFSQQWREICGPNVYSVVNGNKDDEALLILAFNDNDKMVLLDSNRKTKQVLGDIRSTNYSVYCVRVFQFIESLSPV